jgi:hypothetical protein
MLKWQIRNLRWTKYLCEYEAVQKKSAYQSAKKDRVGRTRTN